jgi:hypothetical protein
VVEEHEAEDTVIYLQGSLAEQIIPQLVTSWHVFFLGRVACADEHGVGATAGNILSMEDCVGYGVSKVPIAYQILLFGSENTCVSNPPTLSLWTACFGRREGTCFHSSHDTSVSTRAQRGSGVWGLVPIRELLNSVLASRAGCLEHT